MAEATKVGSIFYEASIDEKGVKQGASKIKKEVGGIKESFDGLSPTVKAIGTAFAAYIGTRAIINFFKSSIENANEAARVMTQTEAVIKSTGGSAGLTAQEVKKMADEIQRTTTIGDEAAQTGMNMLLTFTNIGKEVFPEATQALLDMATTMNGGVTPGADQLRQTAIQLGKALNDPILGMTALRRVGVNFNEAQAEMVRKMVESGQIMEAQKFILRELAVEFGGSAAAQAQTFEGQVTMLKNSLDDLKEDIGKALIPTLGYLVGSVAGLGDAFSVILFLIRAVSSVFLGIITVGKQVGIILSTISAAIISIFRGEFNIVGEIIRDGLTNMLLEGASAQENLTMIWGRETDKQTSAVEKALDEQEKAVSEQAQKVAKSLTDETEKFQDNMEKRKRAFEENLTDLIFAHLDKVKSLKKDLEEENKDFVESMTERKEEFNKSMLEMKASHEKKVADIKKSLKELNEDFEKSNKEREEDANDLITKETKSYDKKVAEIQIQIDKEIAKGKNASQTRLRILRESLAEEQESYQEKVDSISSKLEKELAKALEVNQKKQNDLEEKLKKEEESYAQSIAQATERDNKETARLDAQHQERVSNLNTSLEEEEAILTKHQSEVDKVKDKAREDDITRLIRKFNEENAEAEKQHNKQMANIQSQGTAQGDQLVDSFNQALKAGSGKISTTGNQIGSDLSRSIGNTGKSGAESEARGIVDRFVDAIRNKWSSISWRDTLRIGWPFSNILGFMGLPLFQEGVRNFGGGLAVVGEKGPELVNLPAGSSVIPNDVAFSPSGIGAGGLNQRINIYINKMTKDLDVEEIGRELGFRAKLQ